MTGRRPQRKGGIGKRLLVGALACAALAGCAGAARPVGSARPRETNPAPPFRFVDVTRRAGLRWLHHPCRTGRKYLPETMGGGGGFIDYDADGWLDIVLIDGYPLPGYRGPAPRHALFRNNRDGTFRDVTEEVGLKTREYGMGVAVADYDGDGWPDLYLTAVGKNRLYRNDRGVFRDVTDRAGVGDRRWSTGAAWVDVDGDGRLDLFVANYVQWSPERDLPCGSEQRRQYCPPYQYRPEAPALYRNRGDGTFEDISRRAGILGHPGKTLAVLPCDVNGDVRPDLFLANDTQPDVLLVNRGDGTFSNEALAAGVAVGTDGAPTGSMGVDAATILRDGRLALAVGNFVGQGMSLFVPVPGVDALLFENRKYEAGVAEATLPMSTFGLVFADFDLDGWPDLCLLNGHLDENLAVGERREPYRQMPQFFRNQGDGSFRRVSAGVEQPLVGRGLAVGDYDNDGRPDLLALENGGPARLWRNETEPAGHWLAVELEGRRSPRDGTGAVVTLHARDGRLTRFASTARSYLTANDPRVHFGLGWEGGARRLEVRWPSGEVQVLTDLPTDRAIRVREPE